MVSFLVGCLDFALQKDVRADSDTCRLFALPSDESGSLSALVFSEASLRARFETSGLVCLNKCDAETWSCQSTLADFTVI